MTAVHEAGLTDMGYGKDTKIRVDEGSKVGALILKHLQDYNRYLLSVTEAQRSARDKSLCREKMREVNRSIEIVRVFDLAITTLVRTIEGPIDEN